MIRTAGCGHPHPILHAGTFSDFRLGLRIGGRGPFDGGRVPSMAAVGLGTPNNPLLSLSRSVLVTEPANGLVVIRGGILETAAEKCDLPLEGGRAPSFAIQLGTKLCQLAFASLLAG